MLWPGVELVSLLFSSLRMTVPKHLSLFRVPFCTLLVRPHSVLDTTKQTLMPESTLQQHAVMSLSYPESKYSPPLPPGAQQRWGLVQLGFAELYTSHLHRRKAECPSLSPQRFLSIAGLHSCAHLKALAMFSITISTAAGAGFEILLLKPDVSISEA